MAVRGKQSVTDASGATVFGPQVENNTKDDFCYLINRGPNRCYITGNGEDAVDDTGFNLEPGEAVHTKELPSAFHAGNFKTVCATGETASLYWAKA